MSTIDPLQKPKHSFNAIIEQLSSPDSPVGIDAKYTHAVIIDYLQQIMQKLEGLEDRLDKLSPDNK